MTKILRLSCFEFHCLLLYLTGSSYSHKILEQQICSKSANQHINFIRVKSKFRLLLYDNFENELWELMKLSKPILLDDDWCTSTSITTNLYSLKFFLLSFHHNTQLVLKSKQRIYSFKVQAKNWKLILFGYLSAYITAFAMLTISALVSAIQSCLISHSITLFPVVKT